MKRFIVDLLLIFMLVAIGSSFMEQNQEISIDQKIIEFEKQLENPSFYNYEKRGEAVIVPSKNKAVKLAEKSSDTIEAIVGSSVELVASIFKAIIE